MKIAKLCLSVIALVCLSACGTIEGAPDILGTKGPLIKEDSSGYAQKFLLAQKAAADAEFKDNEQQMAARFLNSGFMLIYSNCSQFFSSAGENQKWITVTRDTVATIGSLAAGVTAINTGGRAATNLALGTGAIYGSLDIFTKNFLFSAENISSVRELIINALDAHEKKVATVAPFTYESASRAIFDHQEICTPIKIASLVREAIKKGKVTVDANANSNTESAPLIAANQQADNDTAKDKNVLQELGTIVNDSKPVSVDQAGYLWWLFQEPPIADDKKEIYTKTISEKLKDLANKPFDSQGKIISNWDKTDQVKEALKKLTLSTQASFKQEITALSKLAEKPVTAATSFSLGAPPIVGKSTRFNVGIKD